ncbi:MAG TPA: PaaX family transcriptional regulator C-terminal domain-containing protein [Ramlibacter sp.]|nr:PaaX family transcriptional regulator C-terminal domain-containing protein [Ramlibacter sp.]
MALFDFDDLNPELSESVARDGTKSTGPGTARSVLLTLLGEFVWPQQSPVWNTTLVQVLGTIGIAEKAARQAIARAASHGWLTSQRQGRHVSWSLTPLLCGFIADGAERVNSLGRDPGAWDSQWLVLAFSLSDDRRAARQPLYSALRWAGFGNPSAGLWVSPHADRLGEVRRILQRLELGDVTFSFAGRSVDLGVTDQRMVQLAWDLGAIDSHYADLKARFLSRRPKSDEETFLADIELVTAWQKVPFLDPVLPGPLRPPNGQGHRIAAELAALRAKWRPIALGYWQRVAEAADPR